MLVNETLCHKEILHAREKIATVEFMAHGVLVGTKLKAHAIGKQMHEYRKQIKVIGPSILEHQKQRLQHLQLRRGEPIGLDQRECILKRHDAVSSTTSAGQRSAAICRSDSRHWRKAEPQGHSSPGATSCNRRCSWGAYSTSSSAACCHRWSQAGIAVMALRPCLPGSPRLCVPRRAVRDHRTRAGAGPEGPCDRERPWAGHPQRSVAIVPASQEYRFGCGLLLFLCGPVQRQASLTRAQGKPVVLWGCGRLRGFEGFGRIQRLRLPWLAPRAAQYPALALVIIAGHGERHVGILRGGGIEQGILRRLLPVALPLRAIGHSDGSCSTSVQSSIASQSKPPPSSTTRFQICSMS